MVFVVNTPQNRCSLRCIFWCWHFMYLGLWKMKDWWMVLRKAPTSPKILSKHFLCMRRSQWPLIGPLWSIFPSLLQTKCITNVQSYDTRVWIKQNWFKKSIMGRAGRYIKYLQKYLKWFCLHHKLKWIF